MDPIVMAASMLDIDQLRTRASSHSSRRASELAMGPGSDASGDLIGADDPVAYEVFEWTTGSSATDLLCAVTVLYAGPDPERPFHTRGHFHRDPDGGEVVVVLRGSGRLDLLSRGGDLRRVQLEALTWERVSPGWAHRVTNLGLVPLVFLSICSVAVGHDYANLPKDTWATVSGGEER